MIEECARRITFFFVSKKYINSENQEIYSYGFEILLSSICSIVFILVLGIILHKLPQAIWFLLIYSSIRKFSGGYHANSHFSCTFMFGISFIIGVIAMESGFLYSFVSHSFTLAVCSIIVFFVSPVLDYRNDYIKDRKKMKYKAGILALSWCLIILILKKIVNQELVYIGSYAIIYLVFILALGLIKNNLILRKDEENE